jgi:hypothetical protein
MIKQINIETTIDKPHKPKQNKTNHKKTIMLIFDPKYEYIFTGPANLIERTSEYIRRTDQFLGHFITYQSVMYHGDIYDDGKAVFQFGTISLGYYGQVEIYKPGPISESVMKET